jgi:hypothetical protein
MPLSYFAARKHIEAIFGLKPLVGQPRWFLGLFESMNPLRELVRQGYSRVEIAAADFVLHPEEPLAYNRNNILFPRALENWTIAGWGLWDEYGNLWYYESLQEPVTIQAGSNARAQAGSIVIRYLDRPIDSTQLGTEQTFEIQVVPDFLIAVPGEGYSLPVVINRRYGHGQAITFSYSGPAGWIISVNPASTTGSYAHLHIQVPLGTLAGTYEITLQGSDGVITRTKQVRVLLP